MLSIICGIERMCYKMKNEKKKTIRLKIEDGVFTPEYKSFLIKELGEKFELEFEERPEYYICSCFDNHYMKYDCIRIQMIGENITPDFNIVDYAVGFDYLNFEDRFLRMPIYVYCMKDFEDAATKHLRSDDYFLGKKQFCNFIYSNNKWNNKIRNDFFEELSKYKRVDSGGKVLNNIGYNVGNKRQFQENYKFSIAFENSRKNGYTTEKIIQAFSAGTIPIYWGNPLIVKEFNPKAFINVFDYPSIEACINRIAEIDQNNDLYLAMQHESIFIEDSIGKQYYDNKKMLVDFLMTIFDQSYEEAKRIHNWDNGYNSEYRKIVARGWRDTLMYKEPGRLVKRILHI